MSYAQQLKDRLTNKHSHTDAGESEDGFRKWNGSDHFNWSAYRETLADIGNVWDSRIDSRDAGRQYYIWVKFKDNSVYTCNVFNNGTSFYEQVYEY